jgi:hypothetical protein
MKLTFLFHDHEAGNLILVRGIIAKHAANITQQDIQHEVKGIRHEKGGLFHDYSFVGAFEGHVKAFEPTTSFKLDECDKE